MDAPAEIHRRLAAGAPGDAPCDVLVARGPLVIMAYGLMSIDPAERAGFWIHSDLGDLSPAEVEEALLQWSEPH
jgi:hypothetical protein